MIDAAYVVQRLQDAHRTMALLPGSVGPATLGAQSYGYVSEVRRGDKGRIKLQPSRDDIAAMDEAMSWLSHITNKVVRKIVSARSVMSPLTERYAYSWPAIGRAVGASEMAVRRWHDQGIKDIIRALSGVGK